MRNQHIEKILAFLPELQGRSLIVNDRSGACSSLPGERWNRFCIERQPGQLHPEGVFDDIVIRLDNSKEVLRTLARFCNGLVHDDTRIWLVGGNDEGIKSVTSTLKGIFSEFETVAIKARQRLIQAKAGEDVLTELPILRQGIQIYDTQREWSSTPGAFAKGKLDKGTELLLTYLKEHPKKRVLEAVDFATGTGILAHAVQQLYPEANIEAIEADAWVLEAAKQNLQQIQLRLSDGWTSIDSRKRYDLLVSNPPVHMGKSNDYSILEGLLLGMRGRMHMKGIGLLVLQSHVFVPRFLPPAIGKSKPRAEEVAQGNGYKIWQVKL